MVLNWFPRPISPPIFYDMGKPCTLLITSHTVSHTSFYFAAVFLLDLSEKANGSGGTVCIWDGGSSTTGLHRKLGLKVERGPCLSQYPTTEVSTNLQR